MVSDNFDFECRGAAGKTGCGHPIVRQIEGTTRMSNLDYQQHPVYNVFCPNGHFIQDTTRPEKWKRKNMVCRGDIQ